MHLTSQDQVVEEMMSHPFLRGLSPAFLRNIGHGASVQTYAVDEYLLREGETADRLFLIFSGNVAIEAESFGRGRLTIETVGAGQVVGWSWSIDRGRYEHDARALKETRAVVVGANVLRLACEEDPTNGYQFIRRLLAVVADRLANTRLQLVELHDGEGAEGTSGPLSHGVLIGHAECFDARSYREALPSRASR